MTACDQCGKIMKIATATFDLSKAGNRLEELDIEVCKKCRILYVSSSYYTLRKGEN